MKKSVQVRIAKTTEEEAQLILALTAVERREILVSAGLAKLRQMAVKVEVERANWQPYDDMVSS